MAKEILAVPEEDLLEVCRIIRRGIVASEAVTPRVREALEAWCAEEEAYMRGEN